MAKRSLKRSTLDNKQKDRDDYWDKIGSSRLDKLDLQDVMDVPDRTIIIGKKNTSWDKITSDLQDTASNTSQFVQLINAHLKENKSKIEKIIELADNFEQEIDNLKLNNENIVKLTNTPLHEFKSDKLRKLTQELLKDRETRNEVLKKLKSDIIKAEEELHQSNKKIEIINEKILEKKLNKNNSSVNL